MCALTSVMAERRGVREAWEKQARTHTWECNTTRAPRHVPRSTPWVFMLPLLLRATGSAAASSRAGMQACDVRTCTSGACDMQPATWALLWPMPVAGVSMPRVRSEGLRLLRLLLWCRTDGPTGSGRVLDMRPPESMLRHVVCASCATGGAFCGASDHRARRGLLDPDRPHRADRCARRLFALFANAMEKCPLGQQSIL